MTGDGMSLLVGYSRCIQAKVGMPCGLHVRLFVWIGIHKSWLSETVAYAATEASA
jgi:hypothetical protein